MTHVPGKIEERLAAVEQALVRLGVDMEQSLSHVDTTPAMTCINDGVVIEAILRDLWKRLNLKGSASKRQLEDLLTATARKLEEEDRPIPRRIHDYIRSIQLTRNRAAHHMDATAEDAGESLRQLSEVSYWYFVDFLGERPEPAKDLPSAPGHVALGSTDVARQDEPVEAELARPLGQTLPAAGWADFGTRGAEPPPRVADLSGSDPFASMHPAAASPEEPESEQEAVPRTPGTKDQLSEILILVLAANDLVVAVLGMLGGPLFALFTAFGSTSVWNGSTVEKDFFLRMFVLIVLMILPILLGAAFGIAGIGLWRRRRWALPSSRILAVVALGGTLCLLCVSFIPLLFGIYYCLLVYGVFLRKSVTAQFVA